MSDTERNRRALDIFDRVCDLPRPGRAAALDTACGDDSALRGRVEALLAEDDRADGPIGKTGFGSGAGVLAQDLAEEELDSTPAHIDSYSILREIGRGGMGVVYEAQQDHPRRRVALKVIRRGLTSRQALQRFQREVQVLGRLDHPGIAQIYAAGSARLGGTTLPYFAMEMVEGLPLDRHIAERGLSTRQVLELIARVCDAVHHAHQREVIHRDLKPANILVRAGETTAGATSTHTMLDGIGLPKVLDFGVARATEQEQEITLQTQAGQIVGTLAYMSPEQLGGDPSAVDTRSDVYALGVILYELLAGRQPHDLKGQHMAEAARRVREQETPRIGQLNPQFRGDIETIVAKAIEKDPDRRYDSAAALGEDLRRYLRDEPILARPATALYQLKKFASRNRALVGGVAATFAALVTGFVAVTVLLIVVSNQRDEAVALKDAANEALEREQIIGGFQSSMLRNADVAVSGTRVWEQLRERLVRAAAAENPDGIDEETRDIDRVLARVAGPDIIRFVIADTILDEADEHLRSGEGNFSPVTRRALHESLGITYKALGLEEQALRNFRDALSAAEEPGGSTPNQYTVLRSRLALLLSDMHREEEALEHIRYVHGVSLAEHGPANSRTVQYAKILINTIANSGRFGDAADEFERLIETLRSADTPPRFLIAGTQLSLGRELVNKGDPAAALAIIEDALDVLLSRGGQPTTNVPDKLGFVYNALERFEEAEREYQRLVDICRARRGDEHEWTLHARSKLAVSLTDAGRTTEALTILEDVLSIQQRSLQAENLTVARTRMHLVEPLVRVGRLAEAGDHASTAVTAYERTYGPGSFRTFAPRLAQARVLLAMGQADKALTELQPIREVCHDRCGPTSPVTLTADQLYGDALALVGRWDEAEAATQSAIDHHWMAGRRQAEAQLQLARIRIARGDTERAGELLRQLLADWPDQPALHDRIAAARELLDAINGR